MDSAKFTAVVDFPTPPLPLATATIHLTLGASSLFIFISFEFALGSEFGTVLWAVRATVADETTGKPSIFVYAALLSGSIIYFSEGLISIAKLTFLSFKIRLLTIFFSRIF